MLEKRGHLSLYEYYVKQVEQGILDPPLPSGQVKVPVGQIIKVDAPLPPVGPIPVQVPLTLSEGSLSERKSQLINVPDGKTNNVPPTYTDRVSALLGRLRNSRVSLSDKVRGVVGGIFRDKEYQHQAPAASPERDGQVFFSPSSVESVKPPASTQLENPQTGSVKLSPNSQTVVLRPFSEFDGPKPLAHRSRDIIRPRPPRELRNGVKDSDLPLEKSEVTAVQPPLNPSTVVISPSPESRTNVPKPTALASQSTVPQRPAPDQNTNVLRSKAVPLSDLSKKIKASISDYVLPTGVVSADEKALVNKSPPTASSTEHPSFFRSEPNTLDSVPFSMDPFKGK